MKLEMTGQMRMEQRMKLAPHMIQSMEILQLPILALQERIEQELNSNPVLEVEETSNPDSDTETQAKPEESDPAKEDYLEKTEDFSRFDRIDENFKECINQDESFYRKPRTGEVDKKLEAIKNTESAPISLHEYLSNQWRLIDAEESVKIAGEMISLPAIETALQDLFTAKKTKDGPLLAVDAIGDEQHPELVLVCVKEIDRATVNRHIAEAGLSSLYNIRHVVQVDDIPILGTGKTNYRALAAQLPQLINAE